MLSVPFAAFDEVTVSIGSVFRHFSLLLVEYLEVKFDFIDSNGVLSGKVLLNTSQETGCEMESWQPVVNRLSFLDPSLEESNPLLQILDVTTQWF